MTIPQQWPVEYADQLLIGNPSSNVAVCCLWSSKDRFQKILSAESYCVIGNLYSRAGINAMLRNILAKPSIRYLVVSGKSLTDSDAALQSFFNAGVDGEWKIIGSGAQIDRDLSIEALNEVRKNVKLIDLRGASQFEVEFAHLVEGLERLPPFSDSRTFPKTLVIPRTLPSEFVGFIVRQRTIYETWAEIIWTIMTFGHISPTDYGLEQKEVLGLLSVIEEPQSFLEGVRDLFPFTKEDEENYLRNFVDHESHNDVAYNYGYRLQSHWGEDQLQAMATELKRSAHSRRAVASLWDPREDTRSSDPVCLTTIQVAIRDSRLHLMAYVRSNDMFRAYPLNAAALAALQQRLTERVGEIEIGPLEILSFSAHIYSDCWELCERVRLEAIKLNRRFEQDDRGSFVFRIADNSLVAEHYSPPGDLLQIFTSDNANGLTEQIAPFVSRVDHAMYLGREIARLDSALAGGKGYQQDEVRKDPKG